MPGEIIVHMDAARAVVVCVVIGSGFDRGEVDSGRARRGLAVGSMLDQRSVATASVPIVAHTLPSRMQPSKTRGVPGGSAML